MKKLFMIGLGVLVLGKGVAYAVNLYVPGSYTTIQSAIDAANYGDTIYVSAGIYTEAIYINKNIALIGAGSDVCTITSSGLGDTNTVTFDGTGTLITGFTITGASGDWPNGYGIFCRNGIDPTVSNCVFSSNTNNKIGYNLISVGKFTKIYDPSIGENEKWYINDHCFILDKYGIWHLFGITHPEPANPLDEKMFAHATSTSLLGKWNKLPFALKAEEKWKEVHLWAPHVILDKGIYYMFYAAGGSDHTRYKIHLATSLDLKRWKRHPKNPVVIDGYDARDPFILKIDDNFVMYYTATEPPNGGNHIVAYRTSKDLINWSERRICFRHPWTGTYGGPTESPFVVKRGDFYYLFIGPSGGYRTRDIKSYIGTDVFRSKNPYYWEISDKVGHIESHGAEIIRDIDGKWYVSHCGWMQGGVYIAPLYWHDRWDYVKSSLPSVKIDTIKKKKKGGLK